MSIKQFVFTRMVGNQGYSGIVSCRGWIDAREWCERAGVQLDGEHVMTVSGVGAGIYVRLVTRLRNYLASRAP